MPAELSDSLQIVSELCKYSSLQFGLFIPFRVKYRYIVMCKHKIVIKTHCMNGNEPHHQEEKTEMAGSCTMHGR